jgi:hypothetical protein
MNRLRLSFTRGPGRGVESPANALETNVTLRRRKSSEALFNNAGKFFDHFSFTSGWSFVWHSCDLVVNAHVYFIGFLFLGLKDLA